MQTDRERSEPFERTRNCRPFETGENRPKILFSLDTKRSHTGTRRVIRDVGSARGHDESKNQIFYEPHYTIAIIVQYNDA